MDLLELLLASLGLGVLIPQVEGAEVLANPLDIHRTYLAHILAAALDYDIGVAYKSIQ